ncbi:alpha-1-antitrypsin-like [Scleropages formosus]|nr:alpha-1-antitrypsin-like [Scleropages formosus]
MRLVLCLYIVLAVLYIPVQGDHHDQNDGSHEEVHGQGRDILNIYHKNANFAFHLYQQIASQSDSQSKNIFFSPLSVSLALAALSLGAKGETHRQLFRGLGFNETEITVEEVNEAFHQILLDLNKKADVDLSVGSALFMNDTFKPRPEFLENMKRYYHSEAFTADFTKTTETRDLINKHVKDKTHGKIPELVKNMDTSTVMYLISYIYFKGKWEFPFSTHETTEDIFHVDEKTRVAVKMMSQKRYFNIYYDQELSTDILELHYGKSVSMMLVLPRKGLKALEDVLDKSQVAKWHKWMKKMECQVFIPKFSISTSYSLQEILTKMGITDIFGERANFTGISEEETLSVSKIIHRATLDIDETGTMGSAVTHILLKPLSFSSSLTMKFNHPFMVIIYEQDVKSILFMGKIVNPMDS